MHENGYSFNGDAPLSGLTRGEVTILQLGHVVSNEQKYGNDKKTNSDSYNKRKSELVERYR